MANPGKPVSDYYVKYRANQKKRQTDVGFTLVEDAVIAAVGAERNPLQSATVIAKMLSALGQSIRDNLPTVDAGLFKQLELAIEMGDLTIPELLVTRKVFKHVAPIRVTINAIVRKYRGV